MRNQNAKRSAASSPRIVVSNMFGDINRGGAAITSETIRIAKSIGADVVGVSVSRRPPEETHPFTRASHPDVEILPAPIKPRRGPLQGLRHSIQLASYLMRPNGRHLPIALQRINQSDMVISKGGFVFVNRASVKELLAMWSTVFPLVYARRVGKPVVAFPTSISSHPAMGSRLLTRWLLSGMKAVFARDPISAEAATDLGVPQPVLKQAPDVVFGLEPPDAEFTARFLQSLGLVRGRFVAISPRLSRLGTCVVEDLRPLKQAVDDLIASEAVDRVVIVDQAEDRQDSEEVAALFDQDAVTVLGQRMSPAELVALYSGARLTIAFRLHAAIFSLVGGTPAIAVSVDPLKAEGVFASLGLPAPWVLGPTNLEQLSNRTSAILQGEAGARAVVRAAVDEAAGRLSCLSDVIRELVVGRTAP